MHSFLFLSVTLSPLKSEELPLCVIATLLLITKLKLTKNLGQICLFSFLIIIIVQLCECFFKDGRGAGVEWGGVRRGCK